ncbi:hypothetical protein [Nostoc sp.]
MLATICIGSHGESKLPSPFNSRSVEAVPFQTIRSGEDISFIEQRFNNVAIKRTQPIELLRPFNSPPLEEVPFQTGGLTKYPSVIPHQPFEPPLNFNYTDVHTDVHNVIKRAALQAAKKAVTDGLQSGQSLDATESLAYQKALKSAKVTNKRFGNLLQDTEISAIASTATQHALKQNNSNTQQGYRTAI